MTNSSENSGTNWRMSNQAKPSNGFAGSPRRGMAHSASERASTRRSAGEAGSATLTLVPQESSADAEWAEFERLVAEGRGLTESKAQHDIRMFVQIARLWECHAGRWSFFLDTKKLQRRPQARSDFQPIVMHWLGATADPTGRGTKCCTVLDEWTRTKPAVPPNEIANWLKSRGGPDGIYRAQRRALNPTSTRDQKDAALHKLVELGPIASFPLPPELAQFGDGDQSALVHIDRIKGTLGFKGVVCKVDQAWLRNHAEALVTSRTMRIPGPTKPDGPIDEFMTKDEVAAQLFKGLLDVVRDRPGFAKVTRWLEPSAGRGAFSKVMPLDRLAIDIAAKVPGVIEHDFLTFTDFGDHTYATAGNPPFTKGAAIKFFNYAARVSAYIGFVVADSFGNRTTQNKLDRHFHLIGTLPVPDLAFVHGGREVSVPTTFQIWERRDALRGIIPRDTPEKSADLEFLSSAEGATYIMKNIGDRAGRSVPVGSKVSANSHFFIRCDDAAIKILNLCTWPPRKVGVTPHLGKPEIIKIYNLKKRQQLSKFVH
jgi:hypothetical protein